MGVGAGRSVFGLGLGGLKRLPRTLALVDVEGVELAVREAEAWVGLGLDRVQVPDAQPLEIPGRAALRRPPAHLHALLHPAVRRQE